MWKVPALTALARAPARRLGDVCAALRFHWLTADKGDPALLLLVAVPILGMLGLSRFAYIDQSHKHEARMRRAELTCLAENVYFESRGEPLAGQYAVAEVTMNRVASPRFPATVCEVVHQASWDALRGRYVGAFSWTELTLRPRPSGLEWARAQAVASSVYANREAPLVDGALFYHATYSVPDWAATKRPIKRIGRHLFYE